MVQAECCAAKSGVLYIVWLLLRPDSRGCDTVVVHSGVTFIVYLCASAGRKHELVWLFMVNTHAEIWGETRIYFYIDYKKDDNE